VQKDRAVQYLWRRVYVRSVTSEIVWGMTTTEKYESMSHYGTKTAHPVPDVVQTCS